MNYVIIMHISWHNFIVSPIFSRGIGDGSTTAFRAAYGRLGELRALLPDVPFIGLSATATDDTISAVTSSLNLNNPNVIRVSINKPNIT